MDITSYPTADAFVFFPKSCLQLVKVAKLSFLVPMRYSSLFSNHWQMAKISKVQVQLKKIILIRFIGLSNVAMATQLVINKY